MAQQVQCPNCGGYQTTNLRYARQVLRFGVLFIATALLWWLTIFLPLIWWVIWKKVDPNKISPYAYACQLCGYEWEQKPNETLPVTVNPDLIRLGEQRLEQERRRRREEY